MKNALTLIRSFAVALLTAGILARPLIADGPATTTSAAPPLPTFAYGVITEADGVTPAHDVTLVAMAEPRAGVKRVAIARSDEKGAFVFQPFMKPGRWSVRLMSGGVLDTVTIAPDAPPQAVRLRLPTGSVDGHVFDASGAAVKDASVTLMDRKNIAAYHATTDENGAYRVERVAPGHYDAKAFRQIETKPPAFENSNSTPLDVDVNALTQDFELQAPRVRAPATRPAAEAP